MLDNDFIRRKAKLIHEDLSQLESLSKHSFDEISQDHIKLAAVERYLEKIIMRAIDINQHIIAELGKGNEAVRGYEDTFLILAKMNIYPSEFAEKIAPSAGLRNRLVYEYNNTKEEIIYQSVSDAIKQYAEYCNYILEFIKEHQ